jgi:hypothetical protein
MATTFVTIVIVLRDCLLLDRSGREFNGSRMPGISVPCHGGNFMAGWIRPYFFALA